MKWSPEFATGIDRIDEQHKMLFRMADDFHEALATGAGERTYGHFLRSLELYIRTHFQAEEGCMATYHCPFAQQNKDAHAAFTEEIAWFRRRFDEFGFTREDAANLMVRIESWLANHIARIDVQLRRYAPQQ